MRSAIPPGPILQCLLRDGARPVAAESAGELPIGRPAPCGDIEITSRLGGTGWLEHSARGTRNLYALAPDGLHELQQWLIALVGQQVAIIRRLRGDRQSASSRSASREMSREMSVPAIRREIRVAATADRHVSPCSPNGSATGGRWAIMPCSATAPSPSRARTTSSGPVSVATVWAEVTEWDPPRALRLNWHPVDPVERATDLRVQFPARGRASTTWSCWNTPVRNGSSDPAAAAREYGEGSAARTTGSASSTTAVGPSTRMSPPSTTTSTT